MGGRQPSSLKSLNHNYFCHPTICGTVGSLHCMLSIGLCRLATLCTGGRWILPPNAERQKGSTLGGQGQVLLKRNLLQIWVKSQPRVETRARNHCVPSVQCNSKAGSHVNHASPANQGFESSPQSEEAQISSGHCAAAWSQEGANGAPSCDPFSCVL